MRLKTYTAPSLADAMVRVRAELGEEAIIVSTEDASPGGEVRVVAARDDADPEDADPIDPLCPASAPSDVLDPCMVFEPM